MDVQGSVNILMPGLCELATEARVRPEVSSIKYAVIEPALEQHLRIHGIQSPPSPWIPIFSGRFAHVLILTFFLSAVAVQFSVVHKLRAQSPTKNRYPGRGQILY